jgi:hypothetical protein
MFRKNYKSRTGLVLRKILEAVETVSTEVAETSVATVTETILSGLNMLYGIH